MLELTDPHLKPIPTTDQMLATIAKARDAAWADGRVAPQVHEYGYQYWLISVFRAAGDEYMPGKPGTRNIERVPAESRRERYVLGRVRELGIAEYARRIAHLNRSQP